MKQCPFCAEMIQEEATFCRFCNRSLKPKIEIHPVFILIGLSFLVGLIWFILGGQETLFGTSKEGRYVTPSAPFSSPPVVTKAEYDQIQDGMTYGQVVQIIGAPGEERSRSSMAGMTTVIYGWSNTNGSNMLATFQNDSLVLKGQYGLP